MSESGNSSARTSATLTFLLIVATLTLLSATDGRTQDSGSGANSPGEPQALSLPYAFYNEIFGFTAGFVYGVSGQPQPQSTVLATVMAGTSESAMAFFSGRDLLMPGTKRLFLDPVISISYLSDNAIYVDGRPGFADTRSGSRDSDKDDYVTGTGWDNFFRLKFKYLLSSQHPEGFGKTYLEVQPFYRALSADGRFIDEEIKTNGMHIGLLQDNRDDDANPTEGYAIRAKYSRDFGSLDSSGDWTNMEAEVDAYVPLGSSPRFSQRVIAFDLWTAYSPSWKENPDGSIDNRPPAYTGASLGGLWRMRGFPAQRFSDKAAVYYSAELRLTPYWNPFHQWPWLQDHVGVEWIQIVPFVEMGRVADSWNIGELHRRMNWCLGAGFRVLAKGIVARLDAAGSSEDFKLQMMISQPFQF